MKKTLLQKALEIPLMRRYRGSITDEEIELAIAWMKGEVALTQINKALGSKPNRATGLLARLATSLKEGYSRGKIKV